MPGRSVITHTLPARLRLMQVMPSMLLLKQKPKSLPSLSKRRKRQGVGGVGLVSKDSWLHATASTGSIVYVRT
jgi:hypothetical protein